MDLITSLLHIELYSSCFSEYREDIFYLLLVQNIQIQNDAEMI